MLLVSLLLSLLLSLLPLATVSEKARRSHSQRKGWVMAALQAKFLFAETACCLASLTALISMASGSAICAPRTAKTLISVLVWASVLEQDFARCDPHQGERHGLPRCRSLPA